MNNKKQLIVSIGLTLVLVLMIVGISYAAFKFIGTGKKENSITTGAITMEYTESDNIISMAGALPTTDATGKVRLTKGEYLDFTVKSAITGTTSINWEIAAEDVTTASKKIDGRYIKFYLTKLDDSNNESQVMAPKVFTANTSVNIETGRPSGMMSLATGTMSTSETNKYRLRMYVDESYNPQGDGGNLSFSAKINVYGKVKEEVVKGSKMKAYMTKEDFDNHDFPETDFHVEDYNNKITSITTKKDNIVPATAIKSWDLSETGDGSVMGYLEDDGTGTGTYKLTIGGKGGVVANESMIAYFDGFTNMTSIDLSALDTSEVTNMSYMFAWCTNLINLDVSGFDTSKVVDMSGMFDECNAVSELDVSGFDTSKVTDMSRMFSDCYGFTSLDVSNFDTSQVVNMNCMFAASSITSLDLSNFDTSKVTDMKIMFYGCNALINLNISSFDTSNVTDMYAMFQNCEGLTSLDISNFDTSKVTDMRNIFSGCKKFTKITVSNKWTVGSSVRTGDMFTNCGVDHVTVV